MRLLKNVIGFFVFFLMPAASLAATFSASTQLQGTGCFEDNRGATAQVALCPQIFGSPVLGSYAEAGLGSLKVAANAKLVRDPSTGSLIANSGSVGASARVDDILSFGIDSGTFEISVDLLGFLNVIGDPTLFQASAQGSISYLLLSGAQQGAFQAFANISGSPGTVGGIQNYTFSFDNGRMALTSLLSATANCGVSNNCFVESTFQNSLRFIGGGCSGRKWKHR